jgi:hypothetical protein
MFGGAGDVVELINIIARASGMTGVRSRVTRP